MGKELVSYKDKMREMAKEYASTEKTGGNWITLRGGTMRYGDNEIPGNTLICIVLDAVRENAYYPYDFDPDVIIPPTCYAFGYSEDDMEPDLPNHEWFEPQAKSCAECPHNEWGSSDTGRGKACGNRRRLAIIPAGQMVKDGKSWEVEVFDTIEDYEEQDIALMKLPVTSTKLWGKYVKFLNSQYQLPPMGVISQVYIEKDPNDQFHVHFDMLEEVPKELYDLIMRRHKEAEEMIAQDYDVPDKEQLEKPKQKGRQGLKGLRKEQPSRRANRRD